MCKQRRAEGCIIRGRSQDLTPLITDPVSQFRTITCTAAGNYCIPPFGATSTDPRHQKRAARDVWVNTNLSECLVRTTPDYCVRLLTVFDRDLALLGESSPRNYGSQESTQQKFAKFIDPIRPLIVGIIRKGISFMPWIPRDGSTDDPSVTSFIHELAIPRLNGIPRLLMHELGQWAEKDAEIAATIRQIFGQHHT